MVDSTLSQLGRRVRAACCLAGLSAWRVLRSRQTVVNLLLLTLALMSAGAWSLREDGTTAEFVRQVFLPVYVSFLLPIFSLCYASPGIAGERQDQTLTYLLATPLPRPVIFVAKFVAALALVLAWNVMGLAAMGRLAGPAGWEAFRQFWPVVLWSSLAYTSLFHLFSVLFRRATIISLGYALFLETFLGNVPGIAKRVAISFYTQCMVFDIGEDLAVGPAGGRNPALFLPISGDAAQLVLWTLAATLFIAGLWAFCRQEYG
jgi:ABC-type transport system involved in multi-copper enzyme maturation permease subunit